VFNDILCVATIVKGDYQCAQNCCTRYFFS